MLLFLALSPFGIPTRAVCEQAILCDQSSHSLGWTHCSLCLQLQSSLPPLAPSGKDESDNLPSLAPGAISVFPVVSPHLAQNMVNNGCVGSSLNYLLCLCHLLLSDTEWSLVLLVVLWLFAFLVVVLLFCKVFILLTTFGHRSGSVIGFFPIHHEGLLLQKEIWGWLSSVIKNTAACR